MSHAARKGFTHLSGFPSITAPCWRRISAHSVNPSLAATCRGVRPSDELAILVKAPASHSTLATCGLLFSTASRKGVRCCASWASTLPTPAISSRQTSTCPLRPPTCIHFFKVVQVTTTVGAKRLHPRGRVNCTERYRTAPQSFSRYQRAKRTSCGNTVHGC